MRDTSVANLEKFEGLQHLFTLPLTVFFLFIINCLLLASLHLEYLTNLSMKVFFRVISLILISFDLVGRILDYAGVDSRFKNKIAPIVEPDWYVLEYYFRSIWLVCFKILFSFRIKIEWSKL